MVGLGGTWHFICSRQVSAPEVNQLICIKICIFLKKKSFERIKKKKKTVDEECRRAGRRRGKKLISGRSETRQQSVAWETGIVTHFGVLQSTVVNNLCPLRISRLLLLLLLLLLFVGLCIFSHSAAFIIRTEEEEAEKKGNGMIIKEKQEKMVWNTQDTHTHKKNEETKNYNNQPAAEMLRGIWWFFRLSPTIFRVFFFWFYWIFF